MHASARLRVSVLLLLLAGCERTQSPTTSGDDSTRTPERPSTSPEPVAGVPSEDRPGAPAENPQRHPPRRPTGTWATFLAASDPAKDADIDARHTGGNRLEIRTQNVARLKLDLTQLPPGVPGRGPWNLQIDRQPIEITGRRGKVLELVRSPAGRWEVAPPK